MLARIVSLLFFARAITAAPTATVKDASLVVKRAVETLADGSCLKSGEFSDTLRWQASGKLLERELASLERQISDVYLCHSERRCQVDVRDFGRLGDVPTRRGKLCTRVNERAELTMAAGGFRVREMLRQQRGRGRQLGQATYRDS